jgi:hypothetical protein
MSDFIFYSLAMCGPYIQKTILVEVSNLDKGKLSERKGRKVPGLTISIYDG